MDRLQSEVGNCILDYGLLRCIELRLHSCLHKGLDISGWSKPVLMGIHCFGYTQGGKWVERQYTLERMSKHLGHWTLDIGCSDHMEMDGMDLLRFRL